MDEENKNPTEKAETAGKEVHHDPSEYSAPSPSVSSDALERQEEKAPLPSASPSEKQPLDPSSKKGLIIACVSIGVVLTLMTTFLVIGYQYSAALNQTTEMLDTGAIINGFYDANGQRITGIGSFSFSYNSAAETPYFTLDKISTTPAKTTTIVLPYAYRNEASANKAYYVLATGDYEQGKNIFESNGNESAISAIYAERYYQKLGSYAFSGLASLTHFSMSNTSVDKATTVFGDYVFADDLLLAKVDTPNVLTSLGEGAFLNCASLKSLTLPKSVTSIGKNAFKGASSLSELTYGGTMAEFSQNITFGDNWRDATLTKIVCANGTLTLS